MSCIENRIVHGAKREVCSGVDGIPYACWGASPNRSAKTLHRGYYHLARGLALALEENWMLAIFIPKNNTDVHTPCEALGLRTLGVSNTSRNIIGGCCVSVFKTDVSNHYAKEQRGFVHDRNFLFNVVQSDAMARIFAHTEPQHSIP